MVAAPIGAPLVGSSVRCQRVAQWHCSAASEVKTPGKTAMDAKTGAAAGQRVSRQAATRHPWNNRTTTSQGARSGQEVKCAVASSCRENAPSTAKQRSAGPCSSAQVHRCSAAEDREGAHASAKGKHPAAPSRRTSGEDKKRLAPVTSATGSTSARPSATEPTACRASTNPVAVSSSRIPRLGQVRHESAMHADRSVRSNRSTERDFDSSPSASSLDLSRIGRNRSSVSSVASNPSASNVPTPPSSRILSPGSIVSARLESVRHRSRGAPAAQVRSSAPSTTQASRLPVAARGDGRVLARGPSQALARQARPARAARAARPARPASKNASRGANKAAPGCGPRRAPCDGLAAVPAADERPAVALECETFAGIADGTAAGESLRRERGSLSDETGATPVAVPVVEAPSPPLPRETLSMAIILDDESEHLSASRSEQPLRECEPVSSVNMSDPTEATDDHLSATTVAAGPHHGARLAATGSRELLIRIESERQSIRGPASVVPPVLAAAQAVDSQLMQLLESDVLGAIVDDSERRCADVLNAIADADEPPAGPQRSFSLPKSFLSNKYGLNGLKAALPTVRFPWRTKVSPSSAADAAPQQHQTRLDASQQWVASGEPKSLPPTASTMMTTTTTTTTTTSGFASIRRMCRSTGRSERQAKCNSSLGIVESESTAVNRSHSEWDLTSSTSRRPWSVYGRGSHLDVVAGAEDCSGTSATSLAEEAASASHGRSPDSSTTAPSSATLRKFRMSFSLRLNGARRGSHDETAKHDQEPPPSDVDSSSDAGSRFRFGPLVWRASRERNSKKACPTKAARNAKCNSGDSGVQMEGGSSGHADEVDCLPPSVGHRPTTTWQDEGASVAETTTTSPKRPTVPAALGPLVRSPRKLSRRHFAKATLRRSASQPAVAVIEASRESPTSKAQRPGDEDAGLYLSEDDAASEDALGPPPRAQHSDEADGMLAIALWDHAAVEPQELSLRAGDTVHVLDVSDRDWWWAARGSDYGWLPASFVQLCERHGDGRALAQPVRHSVRANVINELVTAERDYVKLLSDLVDGYLRPMRCRPDLFGADTVDCVFGNLEQLYRFQKKFLVDLELALDWNALEDSVVGHCFIENSRGFAIYATYCNNHDRAAAQMQQLYKDVRYARFFEACRLLRRMIRLPLEAFLLSPVQKICKYPLQLAELLKHTPEEHADRQPVAHALESMRSVAVSVNESKRRAEMHQLLVQWQASVDHWTGADITMTNSRLVRQGELCKISSSGWARELTLFLFDSELVMCKKDLIKRSSLVYKDRVSVDDLEVLEPLAVMDGRPYAFQLRSFSRAKCYTLSCRSEQDKNQWLNTIRQLQREPASDCLAATPAPSPDPHSLAGIATSLGRHAMPPNKRISIGSSSVGGGSSSSSSSSSTSSSRGSRGSRSNRSSSSSSSTSSSGSGRSSRSKAKQYARLSLTMEEARLTLVGRDVPTMKRKL